ncbi:MAG: hypothetical protein OES09_05975, partial [Gammaproteobacteria bacterium]|nr:hypothetical protein [Gammaproteobacteria bacterium]
MSIKRPNTHGLTLAFLAVFAIAFWPTAISADDGDNLWDESGIQLGFSYQGDIWLWDAVSDGSGGAYYFKYRDNGDTELSRIAHDVSLDPIWAISTARGYPAITPDGSGGAIFAWTTGNANDGYIIETERLLPGGNTLWGTPGQFGIQVSSAFAQGYFLPSYAFPYVASDGIGGAYINWIRRLAYVEPDGTLSALDGIQLVPGENPDGRGNLKMIADGTGGPSPLDPAGGIYAAWIDSGVIGQHVKDGLQWGPEGLVLDPDGDYPEAVENDGTGGMLIGWIEVSPPDQELYVQRLNSNGDPMWAHGGVLIPGYTIGGHSQIVADGSGGAYLIRLDPSSSNHYLYYLNANGQLMWQKELALGVYSYPVIVGDGAGGVILAYSKVGDFSDDVVAMRFHPSGYRLFATWVRRDGTSTTDPGADQLRPRIAFD